MSLRVLVDMNLSVEWVAELERQGFQVKHWSKVGNPAADDAQIIEWAIAEGYVIFTHDLGFATALSLTHAAGPSIIQLRSRSVLPEDAATLVIAAIRQHETALLAGALVVVDESKSRTRVLPLTGGT